MNTNINIGKITESGMRKLETALNEVQKMSRVRTITLGYLTDLAERLNKYLSIPKNKMDGMKVKIDLNAQEFPKAYKYTPESTVVVCENRKGNWYVVSINREVCTSNRLRWLNIPEETKEAIVSKYIGRWF